MVVTSSEASKHENSRNASLAHLFTDFSALMDLRAGETEVREKERVGSVASVQQPTVLDNVVALIDGWDYFLGGKIIDRIDGIFGQSPFACW
jgi:hypothetical protein